MMTLDQLARMFQALPEPEPVVLKLYYNEHGDPIVYTAEKLEGNYIEVDPETFAIASMRVRVVNGVLKQLPPVVYHSKVAPADSGTLCHNQDVSVVVNSAGTYWKKQTHVLD